jgi:hypothetical protein
VTPERWKEVERLYLGSIELEPDERPRFLAGACADEEVRGEVESLLAHRGPGLTFIERWGIDVAAEMVTRHHAEPLVGRTVGRYHVTSLVGAGGMGVVYRARDTRLGRDVALKVLPEDFSQDPDSLLRSEREARLLASLNHPNIRPIWSPDGTQIVFASIAKKVTDLFRKSLSGGAAELLLETDGPKAATDWSTDGRFILYRSSDHGTGKTGWDIWALPIDRAGRPSPQVQIVRTNFDEMDGQLSPDGKWIAYQSNETGRFEVYVQPFPGPGDRWPISRAGGAQVRWRRDGQELFYVALDDRLMAVPIQLASNGRAIEIGAPAPLFTTHIGGAVQGANMQQYMVSSDGRAF